MHFSVQVKEVAYDDIRCYNYRFLEFCLKLNTQTKHPKLSHTVAYVCFWILHPALFSLRGQWEFKHAVFENECLCFFPALSVNIKLFCHLRNIYLWKEKGWHVDVQLIKELAQVLSPSTVPSHASWRKLFPASEETLEWFHAKYCLWPLGCVM